MAGDSSGEVKQVLLATEAELYIEELKTYPLKETGSPKYVSVALWYCYFMQLLQRAWKGLTTFKLWKEFLIFCKLT